MNGLTVAIARIAMEVHPERIEAICSALEANRGSNMVSVVGRILGTAFSPDLVQAFRAALWESDRVTTDEVVAMFRASSTTATLVSRTSSVELVWTGPGTSIVPVRHTAQVLTGLIDQAKERLFFVSFVAYSVQNVIQALIRALERGVEVRILVERAVIDGGNLNVDSLGMLQRLLPKATFYEWDKSKTMGDLTYASVHAKCAVADGISAFITSANLSEAAMERNMELGVLIHGGLLPKSLESHLIALETTRHLKAL